MMKSRRPGAALILACLFLFVVDAIVLATLYMAVMERRLAANASAALRLRLAAESAAATAVLPWTAQLDSVAAGERPRLDRMEAAGDLLVQASTEASAGLLVVRAVAAEPPPGAGRAAAMTLWLPPPLPAGTDLAPAAVSAGSAHLDGGARVEAVPGDSCTDGFALHLATAYTGDGSATGGVAPLAEDASVARLVPRLLAWAEANARPGFVAAAGDLHLNGMADGVVVAGGTVTLDAGSAFSGILIAGAVVIHEDAAVRGAIHVTGHAHVAGSVLLDACTVRSMAARHRLSRAMPFPARPSLPAFQ